MLSTLPRIFIFIIFSKIVRISRFFYQSRIHMKKWITFACLLLGLANIWCKPEIRAEVKEKWMKWANQQVAEEKIKFLQLYGLTIDAIENMPQEDVMTLKAYSDKEIENTVRCYEMGISPDGILRRIIKYDVCNIIAGLRWMGLIGKTQENISQEQKDYIQKMVDKVFKKADFNAVKVVHNSSVGDNVGVVLHHQSQTCYVVLDVSKHQKNSALEDILWHEFAHIIYQDNFQKDLIAYTVWAHSQDERDQIEEKIASLSRACEIRADVFAVINSSDYGRKFISYLKTLPEDETITTHPQGHACTDILEQIQSELESCSE